VQHYRNWVLIGYNRQVPRNLSIIIIIFYYLFIYYYYCYHFVISIIINTPKERGYVLPASVCLSARSLKNYDRIFRKFFGTAVAGGAHRFSQAVFQVTPPSPPVPFSSPHPSLFCPLPCLLFRVCDSSIRLTYGALNLVYCIACRYPLI